MFKKFFITDKQLNNFNFLNSLNEKDYPFILKKICYNRIRERINLSKPKTFLDKINWLKFNDKNPLRSIFLDKVAVREWVVEQIGAQYLPDVYQICESFDEIDFEQLPEKFIIKNSHLENYEYGIKNKEKLLTEKPLFDFVKRKFDVWQNISYVIPSLFELSYKNIKPFLILQEYQDVQEKLEFGVYCFNGKPKVSELLMNNQSKVCIYDENFNESEYTFIPTANKEFIEPTDEMKNAFELSKKLSKDFKFVRVDWKILDGNLYFDKMNFSPYSGLIIFEDEDWNKELGELIKI